MTRTAKFIVSAALLVFALHVVNGIYYGGQLPNCARSSDEGMNSNWLQFDRLVDQDSGYMPAYEILVNIAERVAGRNWTAIYLLVNTVHLALLLLFTYLLGARIRGSETGALAALLVCFYPSFAGAYNRYCMEFALTGVVTAAVYMLLRSEYLSRRRYVLAFFAVSLYGLLLRETIPAFLAGPLLWALAHRLSTTWRRNSRSGKRLLLTVALCTAALAAALFLNDGVRRFMLERLFWESSGVPWYSRENLAFFWRGLWESQLTPLLAAPLLAGVYFFCREADKNVKVTLSLWILLPNLILLFISHGKAARYLLPQLPALALISAFFLRKLVWSRAGLAGLSLLLGAGVFQLYAIFYAPEVITGLSWKGLNYWSPESYLLGDRLDTETLGFRTELPVKIARAIISDRERRYERDRRKSCNVAFFPADWSLQYYIARSYALMNGGFRLEEVRKGFSIIADKPCDIDIFANMRILSPGDTEYMVQMVPHGAPRPPLKEKIDAYLRSSYGLACWALGIKPVPRDWEKLRREWVARLDEFNDIEVVTDREFDAYILAARPKVPGL